MQFERFYSLNHGEVASFAPLRRLGLGFVLSILAGIWRVLVFLVEER